MRAGEVLDYARTLLGQAGAAIPTAHLLQLLQTAQEEVSREAKLPRRVVVYDDLTSANQLVLPTDARKESLIAAYYVAKDEDDDPKHISELPIYDFVSASRYHPQWTLWEPAAKPIFVMYDPAQNPDNPRPAPGPSAEHEQTIRIVYVQKPTRLTDLDSVVFDDKFDGLVPVLAYRVAYLLMRDQHYLREYERAMSALAGQARPPAVNVKNTMYLANALRGAR
jgi:hypothetical protein